MRHTLININLSGGSSRTQIMLKDIVEQTNDQYFIEGIGGSNGILTPLDIPNVSMITSVSEIVCYREGGRFSWGDCVYPSFVIVDTKDRMVRKPKSEIVGNPVQEILLVNFNRTFPKVRISIRNLQNQLLQHQVFFQCQPS